MHIRANNRINTTLKVSMDTLPVELRSKIYEFADVSAITSCCNKPWSRTILLSSILNDSEGLELAAVQGDDQKHLMCELIALSGNLAAVQWARSDRRFSQCDKDFTNGAASGGHLEILKWLIHEQRCLLNENICTKASKGGHLHILKWLREQKCPFDVAACAEEAASGSHIGHLDVLRWLEEEESSLTSCGRKKRRYFFKKRRSSERRNDHRVNQSSDHRMYPWDLHLWPLPDDFEELFIKE